MQTLYELIARLVATTTQDHVVLSLTNNGGSSRLTSLNDLFSEEQLDAMEENCIVSQLRKMPEDINTPEKLQQCLDMADAAMLTFNWVTFRTDGSTMKYNIDNSSVF